MDDYKKMALLFKAFCDENRLHIIEQLQTGEKCACTLLEEVSVAQSTLSHHMKILVESSVVTSRREGKWTYYSLSDDGGRLAKQQLNKILEKSAEQILCEICTK